MQTSTTITAHGADPAVSTTTPVSLAEAREQVRIFHTDLDTSIQASLDAAVEYCEAVTGRAMRERIDMRQTYDDWPANPVAFDRQPVKSISSVKYYDDSGTLTTVSSSLYRLVTSANAAAFLEFDDDFTWPALETRRDAVQVNYVAGYTIPSGSTIAAVVPARAKQAIRLKLSEFFGDLAPQEATAASRACDSLLASLDWGCYR